MSSDDHIGNLTDAVSVHGFAGAVRAESKSGHDKPVSHADATNTDLVDTVNMQGISSTDRVDVTLYCNGVKISTQPVVAKMDGSGDGTATFKNAISHMTGKNTACTFKEVAHTTTSGDAPPASPAVSMAAAGTSVVVVGALLWAGITVMKRSDERSLRRYWESVDASRAKTGSSEPTRPVYDLAERDVLRTEFGSLCDTWLDYDRNIELLLKRPAMRNYERAETAACVEAMLAAQKFTDADKPNLADYRHAVSVFRRALASAEYEADRDANRGMSESERADLLRAQQALAIALDGGATEPERKSAYRLVSIIMHDLGVTISTESHARVMAQIEGSRAPLAQIEAGLRSESVLDSVRDMTRGERSVFISTRVRRAGEDEVSRLTSLLGRTASDFTSVTNASTPTALSKDYAQIEAARGGVADVVLRLTPLTERDVDDDVRGAAAARLVELGEALRNADAALAVGDVVHTASH